jgi:hypothetical protein
MKFVEERRILSGRDLCIWGRWRCYDSCRSIIRDSSLEEIAWERMKEEGGEVIGRVTKQYDGVGLRST